jgi:thiamine pyrophosphokinase
MRTDPNTNGERSRTASASARAKRSAVVLCNGEAPSRALLTQAVKHAALFVCADGGANTARSHDVMPDLVIGDLDSVNARTLRWCRWTRIVRVRRQDNTDLEKALDHLLTKGVRDVLILGAAGGRLDMTLGNLSVLWNYTSRMTITCAGDGWRAHPVVGTLVLAARPKSTVSLVPFGACSGITLGGLKYPLRNARMRIGEIGVSNVAVRAQVMVTVKRGRMLVLVDDDRPWSAS